MRKLTLLAAAAVAAMSTTPAQALVEIGTGTTGNVCNDGGGLPTCVATQTGVINGTSEDPLASSIVARININGNGGVSSTDISSLFASTITGSEFAASVGAGNIVTFNYTPGAGDPVLHYLGLFQANEYHLFFEAASGGITSFSVDMDTLFDNPGLSHIDVFDTTTPGVPEPATWAMMLIGFGVAGISMRYRRRRNAIPRQVA